MTEYELADLAMSKGLQIQELTANYQAMVDSRGDLTQQFMSVLFAYLAAAHFIGATLSRKQAWIFTILYVAWQVWTILLHAVRDFSVRITMGELKELAEFGTEGTVLTEIMPPVIAIAQHTLLAAALAASLYFMWDIRRSRIG